MGVLTQGALDGAAGGLIVEALKLMSDRLSLAYRSMRQRNHDTQMDVVRFLDPERLMNSTPRLPQAPSGINPDSVVYWLNAPSTHATIHELLAVRLSDSPRETIEQLRATFPKTLRDISGVEDYREWAEAVFDSFDAYICRIVADLSKNVPDFFMENQKNAYLSRICSALTALDRRLECLEVTRNQEEDIRYLKRYRRQLIEHHGKLEPPDLQRRRRVPIADIYVSPPLAPFSPPGKGRTESNPFSRKLSRRTKEFGVLELSENIDRTVLLGDPGGGKTTASHVIIHKHAVNANEKVPFLVILRDFAANGSQHGSVIDYIEHRLKSLYQCPSPPAGLVETLLLNGEALVIFDGLDELVDASRRSDIASIIELFSKEYPLSQILVTSRVVGYDEARLDDANFACWRISQFDDDQVGTYVRKWFSQEEGLNPASVKDLTNSFLRESESVKDIRANPLLLALMCILYRGEGYIPENRAEVYRQCANLLFMKWDPRRGINVQLRARHLLEPALRHLAFWLFSREPSGSPVTKQELVAKAATFLHGRGFESLEDAENAADEFVSFCKGRAWVFSDAGTTPDGKDLYTFTHRTFLEYFAAWHLAATSDTPELLARLLLPHIAREEWEVVGQLAIQLKDSATDRGSERVFKRFMADRKRRRPTARANILGFLARCLTVVDPPPAMIRDLARSVMKTINAEGRPEPHHLAALGLLLANSARECQIVADELSSSLDAMVGSEDKEQITTALRIIYLGAELVIFYADPEGARNRYSEFWKSYFEGIQARHLDKMFEVASEAPDIAFAAANNQSISIPQLLGLLEPQYPSKLAILFSRPPNSVDTLRMPALADWAIMAVMEDMAEGSSMYNAIIDAIEDEVLHKHAYPLSRDFIGRGYRYTVREIVQSSRVSGVAMFSAALSIELAGLRPGRPRYVSTRDLETVGFVPYLRLRNNPNEEGVGSLPELPASPEWNALFRRWAKREVDFVS